LASFYRNDGTPNLNRREQAAGAGLDCVQTGQRAGEVEFGAALSGQVDIARLPAADPNGLG